MTAGAFIRPCRYTPTPYLPASPRARVELPFIAAKRESNRSHPDRSDPLALIRARSPDHPGCLAAATRSARRVAGHHEHTMRRLSSMD
jgi:hypothetical protein